MKSYCIVALTLIFGIFSEVSAQYFDYKQGLVARKTFYDFGTLRDENAGAIRNYQNGFELAYIRNFPNQISVMFPIGAGVYRDSSNAFVKSPFYTFGAQAQLLLKKNFNWINPYINGGVNFILPKGKDFAIQVPLGLGLMFKMHPQVYLNIQSDYRVSVANWEGHLQHQFGFVYFFGSKKPQEEAVIQKPDTDGDGIPDDEDLCPGVAGLLKFSGCPDSDKDGIEDSKDKCPELAGLEEFMGCPDTDGDGIPDTEDECPNVKGIKELKGCPEPDKDGDGIPDNKDDCPEKAGSKEMNGCPDTDGDGISDKEDKCPDKAGNKSNGGCPEVALKDSDKDGIPDAEDECPFAAGPEKHNGCPDTDGDGIMDKLDGCPNTPGPIANKGCPVIEKADIETLDFAMRAVQFDLGRATLRSESFSILDKVAKILKKYPDYNLTIAGHTDNSGSAGFNLDLSERRAKICYEYLISIGISASRLSYVGFGSSKPIAPNDNETGRYLNRRVEFNLLPR
ncbi:MAG: OmpA family protein [Saprospiraceae bacterium]|nr:OmpA family protein [Saprospiraceae bacterium]